MTIIIIKYSLLITDIIKDNMKQIRQTLQKEVTYNTVINMMGHPTAEEVYDSVHLSFPHISKATVYRNLSSLEEFQSLEEVPTDMTKIWNLIFTQNANAVVRYLMWTFQWRGLLKKQRLWKMRGSSSTPIN